MLVASAAALALETLGVVGPVVDAKPFYTRLVRSSLPDRNRTLTASEAGRIDRWSGINHYDSGLSERVFNPRSHTSNQAARLVTPICLLANDATSIAWLQRTKTVLQKEKAICYLVKLRSNKDLKQLQVHAEGIPLIALNPVFVIKQFAVPGYPALISRSGVEQ